jgi:hypothetical protein
LVRRLPKANYHAQLNGKEITEKRTRSQKQLTPCGPQQACSSPRRDVQEGRREHH